MALNAYAVTEWMEEHHQGMISCPYQPGLLVISKEACAKRFLAAQQESFEDLMTVNLFQYRVKKGLSVCLNCEIGQRVACSRQDAH